MSAHSLVRLALAHALALCLLGAVLLALGGPPVLAQPLAPSNSIITYPSALAPCNTTLQACISGVADGESILIVPGTYVNSSLSITHPVSLVGNGPISTAVHLQPLTSTRVIQYTGVPVTASFVLSNLVVENGDSGGASGGGIRVLGNSGVPLFYNLVISNNIGAVGGGLRVVPVVPVTMVHVLVISNTSTSTFGGGGLSINGDLTLMDSRVERNSAVSTGGGVDVSGTLTLINTVLVSNTANSGGGAFALDASVVGGSFEGNTVNTTVGLGGGLLVSGTLHLSATQFLSNGARFGGGLYVTGSLMLTNAQFMTNTARVGGGAYVSNTMTMSNGQFISNTAKQQGGGAYVAGNATLSGGRFEQNYAAIITGGGLDVEHDLTATNTVFVGNIVDNIGGGVFVFGNARLVGGRFEGNIATGNAGGSGTAGGFQANGSLTLTGTEFLHNRAKGAGGARVLNGVATLNGARFEGNVANACGGLDATTVWASSSQFVGNTAQVNGGGACASGSFSGVRFENNVAASGRGGGLLIGTTRGSVVITGSLFISNSAQTGGGFSTGGFETHASMINTLFARNQATKGAALALTPGNISQTLSIVHATIADTSLNPASAIAVFTGTLAVTDTIMVNHAIAISNTGGTASEDYNLYSGNGLNLSGAFFVGAHSLSGNPAFVNAAADDYHLGLTSAAIDAGINAGISVDVDDDPRPIGAGFDIGFDEFPSAVRHVFLPLVVR